MLFSSLRASIYQIKQPWANGKLGTLGCSYSGFTAIMASVGDPRISAVYADGPAESEAFTVAGGVISFEGLSWHHFVKEGKWFDESQISTSTTALDLSSQDQKFFGARLNSWQSILNEPTPDASYFQKAGLINRYKDVCSPTIITDSSERASHHVWQNVFSQSCASKRADHRLILVPTSHCAPNAKLQATPLPPEIKPVWAFLDWYLQGIWSDPSTSSKVLFRPLSVNSPDLIAAKSFPPASATELTFYLSGNGMESGSLVISAPTLESVGSFLVNPLAENPCEETDWKLQYFSAPITKSITVVGKPKVELF